MAERSSTALEPDVQLLLINHILLLETLEVLLWLHARGHERRSRHALARELAVPLEVVVEALSTLVAGGLVDERQGNYAFAPATPSLDESFQRLVIAYRDRPTQIIAFMNKNAIERIRTSAVRAFADAFVFGGKRR